MTARHAWIAVGIAAGVLALGYLATKREIHATIEEGEASVTYHSTDGGAGGALTPREDSHEKMLSLIEQSNQAITAYDADPGKPQP
jgi:hypothetical protein